MQARKFEKVIEAQNAKLSEKTALLGSHWEKMQQLRQEKDSLWQRLQQNRTEDEVKEVQMKLQASEVHVLDLQKDAQSHGKTVALLRAQSTALQMKLDNAITEKADLQTAVIEAKKTTEVCETCTDIA